MAISEPKPASPPPWQAGPGVAVAKPHLHDRFDCEPREIEVTLQLCMTDFVHANALQDRTSHCHGCVEGLRLRKSFARA